MEIINFHVEKRLTCIVCKCGPDLGSENVIRRFLLWWRMLNPLLRIGCGVDAEFKRTEKGMGSRGSYQYLHFAGTRMKHLTIVKRKLWSCTGVVLVGEEEERKWLYGALED